MFLVFIDRINNSEQKSKKILFYKFSLKGHSYLKDLLTDSQVSTTTYRTTISTKSFRVPEISGLDRIFPLPQVKRQNCWLNFKTMTSQSRAVLSVEVKIDFKFSSLTQKGRSLYWYRITKNWTWSFLDPIPHPTEPPNRHFPRKKKWLLRWSILNHQHQIPTGMVIFFNYLATCLPTEKYWHDSTRPLDT